MLQRTRLINHHLNTLIISKADTLNMVAWMYLGNSSRILLKNLMRQVWYKDLGYNLHKVSISKIMAA